MKIYRVDLKEGKETKVRLVRAESLAKARAHALSVVSTRLATQEDMLLAVGDGGVDTAIEIEDA